MTEEKVTSKRLRRSLYIALLSVGITCFVCLGTTFAWYIYQTAGHTTKMRMAAGASTYLQIASSYDGEYSSNTVLEDAKGNLTPSSTNRIQNGFQEVERFTEGGEGKPKFLASFFREGGTTAYYRTSIFLKGNGQEQSVLISDIGYEDSSEDNPISTAIRMGFVVHEPGQNQPITDEYIFEINRAKNPLAEYNTLTGQEGWVLDSTKKDGTTIPFTPYGEEHYGVYDEVSGVVKKNDESVVLTRVGSNINPVEVEIYIWLEGCDEDCIINLAGANLDKIAVSFVGYRE